MAARFDICDQMLRQTIDQVRSALADLRPPALDELGLIVALRELARAMQAAGVMKFDVQGTEPTPRMAADREIALYRIAQEAFTNAAKHSSGSRVEARLSHGPEGVTLRIADDGQGFDVAAPLRNRESLGMVTMRERAHAVGAKLEIEAVRNRAAPSQYGPPRRNRRRLMSAISIVIVDDHAMLREGLAHLLGQQADFQVCGSCGDGRESAALVARLRPDVVVIDISMPGLNGIEVTRQIREHTPSTAVVILSMHASAAHVFQALEAGAKAYLQKESAFEEIVEAVRAVHAGRSYLSPRIAAVVAEQVGERRVGENRMARLTRREREILQMVAEGRSSVEIGRTLFLSPRTVDTYRSRLMKKLSLPDLAAVVRFAMEEGVIPWD